VGLSREGVRRIRRRSVCEGNFHGRTINGRRLLSEAQYRDGFGPFPRAQDIPFGDAQALARAITPQTVGFLFEPIQGEGGVNVPREGYLRDARKICTRTACS